MLELLQRVTEIELELKRQPMSEELRQEFVMLCLQISSGKIAIGQPDWADWLIKAWESDASVLPVEVQLQVANIFLDRADFQKVLDCCDIVGRNQSVTLEVYVVRAVAQARMGKSGCLMATLNNALLTQGNNEEIRRKITQALLTRLKPAELVVLFDEASKAQPGQSEISKWLAGIFFLVGEVRAAALQLKSVLLQLDDNDSHGVSAVAKQLLCYDCIFEVFDIWTVEFANDPLRLLRLLEYSSGVYQMIGHHEHCAELGRRWIQIQKELATVSGLGGLGLELIGKGFVEGMGPLTLLGFRTKLRKLGIVNSKLVWLGQIDKSENPTLLRCFEPYLSIIEDQTIIDDFSNYVVDVLSWRVPYLEFENQVQREHYVMAEVEKRWQLEKRPPLLKVPDQCRDRAIELLSKYGFKNGDWFVTLHSRGSATRAESGCWAPRDVRDLSTFEHAIKKIRERGGWVIRAGDYSMLPFPKMDGLIDLVAGRELSDWMHVFLWGNCHFYLGTTSGPYVLPRDFGRPSVYVNWLPIGFRPTHQADLFIPKMIRDKSTGNILTTSQMFARNVAYCEVQGWLDSRQLEVVDSTSDEIESVVHEMLDRLDARFLQDPEKESLQTKYQTHLTKLGAIGYSRIGQEFLLKHAGVLLS